MNYDVIIIGAGPAGYVCAIRASQLGQKVAIVDKEWLGGVCLNVGCIPSKSLLKNAAVAHTLRKRGKEFGFSFDNLQLDYSAAVKRSRQVSNRLTKGVGFLMKKNKIDVHMGAARLTSAGRVEVAGDEGATTLNGKHIVIATGAHAIAPGSFNVDGERVLTYREAILQDSRPARAVIVGSGAIGVEFATVWNSYGADVTIVEMLPRIVPLEDEAVSKELARSFRKDGINLLTGAKVEAIDASGAQVQVTVSGADGEQTLPADQVLVAIGFAPNSGGLGLEELGVALTEHGAVKVDAGLRTNVPGVYAIGDVTGELMLAHAGSAQGIVCAETIAGHPTVELDYKMMPRATYCHPEVASFGLTEAEAAEQGYDLKVAKFNFQANGKALGLGDYGGWVKIVSDAKYGEILGAHMIGPGVTELLPELTLAQSMELTGEEIARNIHAHPSLSEVLMEAAHGLVGEYIHQ
ncbi:MAG: dihydrolipoyl dehydrogenase [Anaerolineales bacterium]